MYRLLILAIFTTIWTSEGFASPHIETAGDPITGPDKLDGASISAAEFEVPELVEIRVQHGESLYDLARWSRVDVEAIEEINGIDLGHPLSGGQRLILPLTDMQLNRLQSARQAFAEQRKDDYLHRRGGLVEVHSYRMKTGDTVWSVSRRHGNLPTWLVKAFNPALDLNRVRIGQRVQLPVVGDMLVPDEPCAPPGPSEGC